MGGSEADGAMEGWDGVESDRVFPLRCLFSFCVPVRQGIRAMVLPVTRSHGPTVAPILG